MIWMVKLLNLDQSKAMCFLLRFRLFADLRHRYQYNELPVITEAKREAIFSEQYALRAIWKYIGSMTKNMLPNRDVAITVSPK